MHECIIMFCAIFYNKIQFIVFTVNCKLEIVMVMNAERGEILDPRISELKPEVFATKRPVDPTETFVEAYLTPLP